MDIGITKMSEEKKVTTLDVEAILDRSTKSRKEKNYEEARKIDEEGYEKCVLEFGERAPETLRILTYVAVDLERLGLLEEALKTYEKIYEAKKLSIGSEHKETIEALVAVSSLNSKLGRHEVAKEIDQKILAIRTRNLGPDHVDTLSTMNNLAYDMRQLEQYQEAREVDGKVYEKRKEVLGKDHEKTISSGNHYVYDCAMLEDYEEAARVQEELYYVLKDIHKPEDEELMEAMTNLSTFYYEIHKHDSALDLDEEIYHTQQLVLGEDSEDTLLAETNLSFDYHQLGQYEKAEKVDQSIVEKYKTKYGEKHLETLQAKDNLALDYYELGKYAEALEVDKDLYTSYPEVVAKDATYFAILSRLVEETQQLDKQEERITYLEEKLNVARNSHNEHVYDILVDLAHAYRDSEDYEKAIGLYNEILTLRQASLGNQHDDTIAMRKELIDVYNRAEKYEAACQEYEILFDAYQRRYGNDHAETLAIQEQLAQAYMAAELADQAEKQLRNLFARRLRLFGEQDEATVRTKNLINQLQGIPSEEPVVNVQPTTQEVVTPVVEEPVVEEEPTPEVIQEVEPEVEQVVEEQPVEKQVTFVDEVKAYYEMCLQERGEQDRQTLRAQAYYAHVLSQNGEEDKAFDLIKDVYNKYGKFIFHLGHYDQQEHEQKKLARVYWKNQQFKESYDAFVTLLEQNTNLYEYHPDVIYSRYMYAKALSKAEDGTNRIALLKELLNDAKLLGCEQKQDALGILDELANDAMQKHNYTEALHLHRELYSKWLRQKGANDVQTIYYENLLAKDYALTKFGFRNAELYGKDAYERLKRVQGPADDITISVGLSLVRIYMQFDKHEDAKEVLNELKAICKDYQITNKSVYRDFEEVETLLQSTTESEEETPVEKDVVEEKEEVQIEKVEVPEEVLVETPFVETEIESNTVEESSPEEELVEIEEEKPVEEKPVEMVENMQEELEMKQAREEVNVSVGKARQAFASENFFEASQEYEQAYANYRLLYGEDDLRTLALAYEYGLVCVKLGKYHDARKLFEVVYEKRNHILGEDHTLTIDAERELSKACHRTGDGTTASMLAEDIYNKLNKKR